jgi:predicted small secreted protein
MRMLVHARKDIASALLALVVLAGAAATLSACNTAAGFGEDMAAAGHAVANSAEKLKGGE